jgi:hypothetical protein
MVESPVRQQCRQLGIGLAPYTPLRLEVQVLIESIGRNLGHSRATFDN